MDYDVVKTSVQEAYRNYRVNNTKFYNSMGKFYEEGVKNPSVSRIILQDHIRKGMLAANDILKQAIEINYYCANPLLYGETAPRHQMIYGLSLNAAIKSIEAQDMYKNSESLKDELGTEISKNFDKKWDELYPRTGKIRKRIIEANRISMDNVTQKADWFSKINFAKTLGEYKKDYPKSFYVRYYLIMKNQIKDGEVTTRVKGWFKRFSYKRLIKSGYSFKK